MKSIFKNTLVFWALLLSGGVLTGEFISGQEQSRVYSDEVQSLLFSSDVEPGIFAVEPPVQSVARSLHLYPESTKDTQIKNTNSGSSGFKNRPLKDSLSSSLSGYSYSIHYSFIRSILFPFHSFL